MRAIFISYRRNDAEGEAGRLFDDLVREFSDQSVFMDVSTIEAGRDFRKVIDESVSTCGVLLSLIGPNWLDAKNEAGERRLDDPADFVRLETASALKRDIPVIPVLVRGSRMPRPDSLPEDLKDLAYRNGVELTHPRWNSDVQLLIKALRPFVEPPTPPVIEPPKPSPVKADLRREAQLVPTPLPVQPAPRPSPDGTYGDVEVKKRSRLIPSLIACGLALLGAIAAYFYLSQKNPTVPDVRGGTLAEATTKLESAHLAVGRTRTQIDPSKEANTVIAQTPPPNINVSADTKVDLVLSPPEVQVPNLVGKSLNSAESTLHDVQLFVGEVQREPKEGAQDNSVLREFPPAGESVKPGLKVDLVVAAASSQPPQPKAQQSHQPTTVEPAKVKVPNIVGQPLDQARKQLAAIGLAVGNTTGQVRDGVTVGTVLSQTPNAGQQVRRGASVDVAFAQPPVPIRIEAQSAPKTVSPGGDAGIIVSVWDANGQGIPNASVTVSAGGGTFSGSGASTVTGNTNSSGVFRTSWRSPNPAAKGYVMGVKVTKEGYQNSTAQLTVPINPPAQTAAQPPATITRLQVRNGLVLFPGRKKRPFYIGHTQL